MIGMPGCLIRGAVLGVPAPRYERGPVACKIVRHPYLRCVGCDDRLWWGEAWSVGTPVFVCRSCNVVADQREVP